ncbi:MAG: flippase, partial [Nocardioidaceae bacterium]
AGVALFARAGDATELWYRSQMRSRDTASIRLVVTGALFIVRCAALWLVPNIWVFLALFVAEAVIASVWISVKYLRDESAPGLTRPAREHSVGMLPQSYPLLLSGIANQVNLRGDVVILQALAGSTAVGVYSAAARMSELAYFLPTVFMNATLPVLLQVRKEYGAEHPRYLRMLQRSYDQAFWVGVVIAVTVGVTGTAAISMFFGPAYDTSKHVLWIHVAACPFVFMAAVYSKWIIAEGTLWSSLVRHSLGAVANIVLNIVLIPRWGPVGSAVATLCSYVLASYVACFIGRRSRLAGRQMTLALIAPARLAVARLNKH